ncbi:leader peptidase HopD [Enterobacter cloacae]|uniref:Leader peptidase HopD n=1 Tax=Enterobacter cloacae TaxID=550 RepID=A0A377LS17_ENTCL|nr:leader peptidase HopD [Enterobacter cloacae]
MLTLLPFLLIYFVLSGLLVREDIRSGILPDKYLCPLLWAGLLYQLCLHPDFLPGAVVGAMAGYVGFAMIYWGYRLIFRREGMGYGDVKYLSALGAWHGWWRVARTGTGCRTIGAALPSYDFVVQPCQTDIKKPTAFWAISGGSGFMRRLADAR